MAFAICARIICYWCVGHVLASKVALQKWLSLSCRKGQDDCASSSQAQQPSVHVNIDFFQAASLYHSRRSCSQTSIPANTERLWEESIEESFKVAVVNLPHPTTQTAEGVMIEQQHSHLIMTPDAATVFSHNS